MWPGEVEDLTATLAALLVVSGAQPEAFGFVPVSSITSPPDEAGEVSWATAGMIIGLGWQPTTYHEGVIRALFGEPTQVAPDVRGWAFGHVDAPAFGIVLIPGPPGRVTPHSWDWGTVDPVEVFRAKRTSGLAGSAWLNALADFQREVLPSGESR